MFDTSGLPATSTKRAFPWRETRVALIRIREDGTVEHAGRIAEKLALLERCDPGDCILAVRLLSQPQPRPDVLVVDNRADAVTALSSP